MEKKMFALTYCFEGVDDNAPYACTIAVSDDKEKLREEMMKCVEEDCTEPTDDDEDDDDEWNTDCNYMVYRDYGDEVILQHKKYINLDASYKIRSVEVL